tara:strand:- start:262 stop:591 length:330 start_codon:yes stop_codon:yes gene_type:complete
MKITKRQLRRIIREAFTTVSDQDFDRVTMPGYKGPPAAALKDYSDEAIQAAAYAVKKVPYPQGGMIENEIHSYLESDKGLDSNSDEIFTIADEALEVAGIMLDLGPNAL